MAPTQFHDAARRLVQVGQAQGVQLVQITALDQDNRYQARPIEFDANEQIIFASEDTLIVLNLAEPAGAAGQVPAGTDAVAVDVEGHWIIFVRPQISALFPARIVSAGSGAAYTVREQTFTSPGGFADRSGVSNVTAYNLAELSLGPGGAVDDDEIVMVMVMSDDSSPSNLNYFFDHPAYAKYLD